VPVSRPLLPAGRSLLKETLDHKPSAGEGPHSLALHAGYEKTKAWASSTVSVSVVASPIAAPFMWHYRVHPLFTCRNGDT
jgi:hypothetical protein